MMRRPKLANVLVWSAPGLLFAVALYQRDPILIFMRGVATPLLLALGLAAAALAIRQVRRGALGRRPAGALLASLIAVGVLVVRNEAVYHLQKNRVLAAGPEARRLGAHFVVGYTNREEISRLAERGLIGGIYLARRNVVGRSAAAIRAEIDALQAVRARAGLPPLIVAADQEGGKVQHLSPPLPAMPALATLLTAGSELGLDDRARQYGQAQGRALAGIGVNLNLGPVVDLRPEQGGPAFDTHTRIASRAIGTDPAAVSRVARAYGLGLASSGVAPTLKHFPGLRYASADTHHFPARLNQPASTLAAADWRPFQDAQTAGGAIMLGHVIVPELDPDHPASLSPRVIRGLLRDTWKYDGILITDDLDMGAVYRRGIGTATTQALQAGAGLVLIAYDPQQFYRAMDFAVGALRRCELSEERLAESRRRLERMRERAASAGFKA